MQLCSLLAGWRHQVIHRHLSPVAAAALASLVCLPSLPPSPLVPHGGGDTLCAARTSINYYCCVSRTTVGDRATEVRVWQRQVLTVALQMTAFVMPSFIHIYCRQ